MRLRIPFVTPRIDNYESSTSPGFRAYKYPLAYGKQISMDGDALLREASGNVPRTYRGEFLLFCLQIGPEFALPYERIPSIDVTEDRRGDIFLNMFKLRQQIEDPRTSDRPSKVLIGRGPGQNRDTEGYSFNDTSQLYEPQLFVTSSSDLGRVALGISGLQASLDISIKPTDPNSLVFRVADEGSVNGTSLITHTSLRKYS